MKTCKIERTTKNLTEQGYTLRRIKNALAKEELKEQSEKNQKLVESIVISIEWKKSQMWGSNPHAEAKVHFKDGTYTYSDGYTCSGCGYDKESTVIAQIFDDFLMYRLWELEETTVNKADKPYGCRFSEDHNPYYEGGVGTNCYYKISEFIGGKFESISCGKTFNVYKFTMNEKKVD